MAELALNLAEKGGCISILMQKARENGTMNYEDLLKCIRSKGITEQDQINDIIEMIEDMGISISAKPI